MSSMLRDISTVLTFLCEGVPLERLVHADAIFVFGHFDPAVAHHATRLYHLGKAKRIIITGCGPVQKSQLGQTPAQYATEADHFAELMASDRVPREAFILEREARHTLDNVRLGMAASVRAGFSPGRLILVSMPPLLRRAIATFHKHFPSVSVQGSAFELSDELIQSPIRLQRVLGEFERFTRYAQLGDIVHVPVPEDVRESVQRLQHKLAH